MSQVVETGWQRVLGWFIARKPAVFIALGVLLGTGLAAAPFDWDLGGLPRNPVPVDAIPDISENQQIVFTEWPGRSPTDVEDQITYPLTTALLGIPGVRTVRSVSMFGFASVYVIFADDVEFYWARARVLEKLASLPRGTLPDGVSPALGPDATALGQVFWYTLQGRDREGKPVGGWDLHELRSIQDWTVRYALQSVPGVAEVASVGGYVKEYQIDVDPEALRAHGVTLAQVANAVRGANLDVGARTIEINRVEYVVRGIGLIESIADLEATVVRVQDHVPIRVADVARVSIGPADRRGALDNAGAETVGGVVVVRYGANPLATIERVKAKIGEIAPGLPRRTLEDGTSSQVAIVPFYDRTTLIHETLDTLSTALLQQILVTVIVVLVMLRHLRSAGLISAVLPLAVLGTFIAMRFTNVDANIMSLAGIAIAIGTMVDMGIVLTENIVARLATMARTDDSATVVRRAAAEVAPAVMTATATTVVSFLPVFALTEAEGKLFHPLAYTKTFALLAALVLSIAVLPPLAHLLLRLRTPRAQVIAPRWLSSGWLRLPPGPPRGWIWLGLGALVAVGVAVALAVWLLPLWSWPRLSSSPGAAPHWSAQLVIWAVLSIAALGGLRLIGRWLPARWAHAPAQIEIAAAVTAGAWLLTRAWMPLGWHRGILANLLCVALLIASVLGSLALFQKLYPRLLRWFLAHKGVFLLIPGLLLLLGSCAWLGFGAVLGWLPAPVRQLAPVAAVARALPGLGREFMPPFDEGTYLYMPTTMPHASFGEARDQLQAMDAAIARIPEVEEVIGKLGRVESALDPAPVSMFETVVTYKPEYRIAPDGRRVRQWRDHIRSPADIWRQIVSAAQRPGLTSAPELMPIATRIVMLQSGMRAPLGIKVRGPDLNTIEQTGLDIEALLKQVPSIRPETVFADRVVGKPYIEIEIDRQAIGRYGLTIADVQAVIQVALGGSVLTRTVEGRARYPVRVRYLREERDSVEALARILVATPTGAQIPLGQLAALRYARGPQAIKAEDTFLTSYVLFDRQPGVAEVDVVEEAREFLQRHIASGDLVLPAGVSYAFAGTYENQVRSEQRLMVYIPLALAVVLVLLYLQFRRLLTAVVIYAGVIVAMAGGFVLLWLYGQPWFLDGTFAGVNPREVLQVGTINLSVAVWIGFIALIGIATDDGVVMATYLDQRFADGAAHTVADIRERVVAAGMRRVRPCLMTTATTLLALFPVVTAQGRGADVMRPMAVPVIGGMAVALITLFIVPVLYGWIEEQRCGWRQRHDA